MEDGDVVVFRATKHGKVWRLQTRPKSEEEWTYHDPPDLERLFHLRDMLWRKYQRNRVPFEHVAQIDGMIEDAGGTPPLVTNE